MTITERQLHPDWSTGEHDAPTSDLRYALEYGRQQTATPIPSDVEREITFDDVEEVVRYSVSYEDVEWKPGAGGGTELNMVLVARLTDGRWIAIEAWNDYTGWGCQDGSDVRVGASEDQVVRYGLSNEARGLLKYEWKG